MYRSKLIRWEIASREPLVPTLYRILSFAGPSKDRDGGEGGGEGEEWISSVLAGALTCSIKGRSSSKMTLLWGELLGTKEGYLKQA